MRPEIRTPSYASRTVCKLRRRRMGFSLIEVMVVTAILATLASVAIPSFQTMIYRTQRSERAVMIDGIEKAVVSYHTANGDFPTKSGGCSYIYGWFNPWTPWPPNPLPRVFDLTYADWRYLGFSPSSPVRYSYYAYGSICPTSAPWFMIYAYGDLDGNGILNYYYHYWSSVGGGWSQTQEWEWNDPW